MVPDEAGLGALFAGDHQGFVVTGLEIVFQGLCPSCVAAAVVES